MLLEKYRILEKDNLNLKEKVNELSKYEVSNNNFKDKLE